MEAGSCKGEVTPPPTSSKVKKIGSWRMSPGATARLRGGELEGLNLRKEFERLGAEAQHLHCFEKQSTLTG